jgi:signal transduction histidine kinase
MTPTPSTLVFAQSLSTVAPTHWELYRWYIIGAIAVVALQALTIVSLVIQRSRRRETQARNEAILRAIPDMMFLLNKDGVYVDYSAPDESRLLVRPEQFLGRRMRDVLPAPIAAAFEDGFARLTTGQRSIVIEYALAMGDEERQYEARIVSCRDDQVLSIVRDVTEGKRAEQALHQTQAELIRVSRLTALGEFAASIAHEVRQPLTAVMVNAKAGLRWISGTAPDLTQVRAALMDVVDASQRADDVIRRNRELFDHHTVQKSRLDLNEVIREVALLAKQRLRTSAISLRTSLTDGLPAIHGDRIELQQVVLNLISNSIDAMEPVAPRSRQIAISTTLGAEGLVKVAVTDSGVGLEGVDVEQMFSLSYTTKPKGSGVGLSISKAIVEAHGGRLWGEQNSTGGATFSFTIPAGQGATG